ncbi:Bug family tripartite tricarboxylate transporter substrate binding protein [Ramlibacter rhizophilus]|uniref:Tripartite tricarboxylate transporter substrate binding protein n=1 Tax=Ramlibacter rhizophilus TaxID=1781167 RepID=A0A4Z0BVQ9_9BURK|nr:tripartite tricarboxylate transporter substrate binding protein [Ramlibacter rhizophilus]TFZ03407.1 tripartite tricarboxylate transporter substrate binding protein [Ramlibacter rhizophilus]
MKKSISRAILVPLLAGVCQFAAAQDFPSGPVRLVVPYPPGGGVDGLARPLAERLSNLWGKPVIVENKAGAATIIGSDHVAKATPDGHTLLFTSDSSITSNPHLYAKMPLDPMKDLVPVTQLIDLYQMVVVHPSVKANTMKEFVELAKSQPTPMNYGSYGAGSQPNLLFEGLKLQTGINMTHVPYKGIAPAIQATLANEVQATLGGAATTGQYFSAGKMKPLAISAPKRSALHPNVPTLQEAGFPDIGPQAWFGILAPAGTPQPVLDKISRDVAKIMAEPAFDSAQITGKGYQRVGSAPKDFGAFIEKDFKQKGEVIKGAGIKVE